MSDAAPALARLGFELEEPGVNLWGLARAYRGVERMYYAPNPFELGGRAKEAWGALWEAEDEGRLRGDVLVADEMVVRLAGVGVKLEVIYSEVVVLPDEAAVRPEALAHPLRPELLSWLPERSSSVSPPPETFCPLGFDISTPNATYHSIIRNGAPGVDRPDELLRHLNEAGLTEDLAYAKDLMDAANATGYRLGTFCVLRVYSRKPGCRCEGGA